MPDSAFPWWRKYARRWEILLAWAAIVGGSVLGVYTYSTNSREDIERNEDTIEQIVCGLKFFVTDLIEAGSQRESVLERLDARLPAGVGCVESDRDDP